MDSIDFNPFNVAEPSTSYFSSAKSESAPGHRKSHEVADPARKRAKKSASLPSQRRSKSASNVDGAFDLDLVDLFESSTKRTGKTKRKHQRSKSAKGVNEFAGLGLFEKQSSDYDTRMRSLNMDGDALKQPTSDGLSDSWGVRKRAGSATGKQRGNYNCGRCGVPKKGHVCPHDQPKVQHTVSTQTCILDHRVVDQTTLELLKSLQSEGIITVNDPAALESRALTIEHHRGPHKTQQPILAAQLPSVDLLSATAIDVPVQAAAGASLVDAVPKIVAPSLTSLKSAMKGQFQPKLRTFDSGDSILSSDLAATDIDMDLGDAFGMSETLGPDPLGDKSWLAVENPFPDEIFG
jgi:hypothetical protein